MAHALKRISYATCDPDQLLFNFLARQPHAHFSFQYCHSFLTRDSKQAEELNAIVGNAFRMAYAAQLQKTTVSLSTSTSPTTTSPSHDVITSPKSEKIIWTKENLSSALHKSPTLTIHNINQHQATNIPPTTMDVQLNNSTEASTLRLNPPSSIPGLKVAHKYNMLVTSQVGISVAEKSINNTQSTQSTPSSDESNSPTEMNSYKRIADKPPLIKRFAMGFSVNHNGDDNDDDDDDSCPLVVNNGSMTGSTSSTPGSPTNRPLSGGYVNESINDGDNRNKNIDIIQNDVSMSSSKHIEMDNSVRFLSTTMDSVEYKKRISQISSSSSSSCPQTGFTPTPPPLPERSDSLNNREEGELRGAPWFQAGIPREIALEILAQEPTGAFMVRESTSKPGCFALSLRVPRNFQPTGIAHYLIVRINKGYKIKGFTKEFGTLTSLITHHSVMPELLPCPLSLSRYNPTFVRTDSKRDFADIDLDPDYNTLADFRKMMADLNI